ncbi:MAG: DMT family transporter [Mangrovicoccus sp.]|nr:DMT family transporter [Mangrovicoccus sp.]
MSRPNPSSLPPGGPQSLLAGRLALVAAALFWSGNFVAGRALREALDPLTLNLLRWCLAAAIFTPFVGRTLWRTRGEIRAHWRVIIGLCVTGVIGFQVLTYQALTKTTVVNAVLMLATMPVMILGLSAALSRKRIPVAGWAAVALSVLGVAVLLTGGDLSALAQARLGRGDLWMLAAVLAWSIYTLLLRQRPAGVSGNVLVLAMVLPALPVMGGRWPFGGRRIW